LQNGTDFYYKSILISNLLRKGILNGIWISSENEGEFNFQSEAIAEIFQISGIRNLKSSLVSCPGCSRSTINLERICKNVKNEMKSEKIKISVMGCGVNGYGEMMKSDFGIIGSSPGKVDLFKHKRLIASSVNELEILNVIKRNIA